jgi:membrane protein DedA with SNARE-associated domain
MNPLSSHVAHYGLPFVVANVFLEQLGVPIPAEPTLMISGALAKSGQLSPLGLLGATVAAAIIADSSLFLLGRRWQAAVWRIVGRLSRSGDGSEERAKPVYARWGLRALVLARFLPGVSQLMVLMAGATGARFRSFLGYDLIGAVLWSALPIGGGMLFSVEVEHLLTVASRKGLSILLAVAAAVAVLLVSRRALRKSSPLSPSPRHGLARPPSSPLSSASAFAAVVPNATGSAVVKIPAVGGPGSSAWCSLARHFEAFRDGAGPTAVAPGLQFRADLTGGTVQPGEGSG